jgi:hypothetical protein
VDPAIREETIVRKVAKCGKTDDAAPPHDSPKEYVHGEAFSASGEMVRGVSLGIPELTSRAASPKATSDVGE